MNELKSEKSPYLLQHANNPVGWYPWGKKAFDKAKEDNKPIFLSIGYSTCHWCHVMAHESFEDKEVAELINEVFIPIKVDREERPDIDQIYMNVCQILNGSGGWPLTVFLTPDKKPFFAGTYFPKESRFGRIGLIDLVLRIKELWNTKKSDLLNNADEITFSLQNLTNEAPGDKLGMKTIKKAYNQLVMQFDTKFGGFSSRPKFPTPQNLIFLLRFWKRTGKEEALNMVEKTLKEMRKGGIYDHIGFGFHRYSTDSEWRVPHFEKILSDQALIANAYIETYQVTNNLFYAKIAKEILRYVLRDMTSPEGGFYSAEDADSEGVEGKFYIWSEEELKKILDKEDFNIVKKVFNVFKEGNYLEEATREKTGNNIFYLKKSYEELATELNIDIQELGMKVEEIRQKLFSIRKKRIHPLKDDKILTDWNGLMIATLAKYSRIINEPKYLKAAKSATEFILSKMMNPKGRLLHRFRDNKAEIEAYLNDYTFLIWGLIELYETTFDSYYLKTALHLNEILIEHFWDNDIGGFYFTADDSEKLIVRTKEIYDGAIPSGNSIAILNLLRLSYITGNNELEEKADILSRVYAEKIRTSPAAYIQFLIAVDFTVGPTYSLVIAGDSTTKDTHQMIQEINKHYLPNKVIIYRPTDNSSTGIDDLSNFIGWFDKINEKATAYVCANKTCKPATNDLSKMVEYLNPKWET
ncbi:MAG: thioredoxin domain-containing protein [Candidatus Hermodarchaeota archaeon]